MAEILRCDLDDETVQRLEERARRNGRTLEAEAKLLLENAAGSQKVAAILDNARNWRSAVGRHFERGPLKDLADTPPRRHCATLRRT